RPLQNPLGGAPGFVIGNVYVLPGLPAEMEAMFATAEEELRRPQPIRSWRRRYRTRESTIVGVLEAMGERHPGVLVGSYPTFGEDDAAGAAERRARALAIRGFEATLAGVQSRIDFMDSDSGNVAAATRDAIRSDRYLARGARLLRPAGRALEGR